MPKFLFSMVIGFLLPVAAFCQNNCDNLNLAAGLPAASAFGYGTSSPYAFDGSSTTYWTCPTGIAYPTIGINLGTTHGLCHFTFEFVGTEYPISFVIQGGNDFGSWTTIYTQNNNTGATVNGDIATGKDPYKMYQMVILDPQNRSYKLAEAKFFDWIDNTIPTITITTDTLPNYYVGSPISLTSLPSVTGGGTITKVEYFKDSSNISILIGTSTSSPFSVSWTPSSVATYKITAKATTSLSKTKVSSPANLKVLAQPSYMKNWLLSGTNLTNTNTGTVFIGTAPSGAATIADAKLLVYGNIYAQKLTVKSSWADFVFDKSYKLRSLNEVESFVLKNKHLPEVPTAQQVEANGVSVGDSQAILLRKVEELTLYLIQQNKKIEKLENQLKHLKKQPAKK